MKNVWILNHYAQKPDGPGGTRHFSLAQGLRNYGWHAVLIASSIEHGTGRNRLKEGGAQNETFQKVEFCWIASPGYKGNGFDRILNILAYSFGAWRGKNTRNLPRPDVIIGSSVHPLAAFVGQILARRLNVPFIFEVRDLWPQSLIDMGGISRHGPVAWLLGKLEVFLYRRARRIVTLLPNGADYITKLGIEREKIVWIPNGVDVANFDQDLVKPNEVFTFMYFGSHGIANGLGPIINAFHKLCQREDVPNCRLRFVGEGPEKATLIEMAAKLGLAGQISFEAAVPKSEISRLASQADGFLINVRDLPIYRFGISMNKIFDYLAAARPIIFAGSVANSPVADANAGICVPADDENGMADAMARILMASDSERAEMGKNGREFVAKHFDNAQLAKKLAGVLDQVLQEENKSVGPE